MDRAFSGRPTPGSRPPSVEQTNPFDDAKGPLGLNLLHSPLEPFADFVFVHGLGGGSRKTWSKTADPNHYWPKEWLPRDVGFQACRIYSFGYVSDWSDKKDSVLAIADFAHSLLGEIKDCPEIRKSNVAFESPRNLNFADCSSCRQKSFL